MMAKITRARLRKAYKQFSGRFKRAQPRMEVIAGRSDGTVFVSGTNKRMIYVRRTPESPPFTVWNKMGNPLEGMHLFVGESDYEPGVWQVLDVPVMPAANVPIGTYTNEHGYTHLAGSTDPAYIASIQIVDGLIYPSSGMTITINAGFICFTCCGSDFSVCAKRTGTMAKNKTISKASFIGPPYLFFLMILENCIII